MIRPSALSPARLFTGFAAAWLVLWGFFFVTAWVIPGSQSPFFAGTADLLRDFLNPMIYASELDPYRNPVNGLWEKSHPPLFYLLLYGIRQFCLTLEPEGNGIFLLTAIAAMLIPAAGLMLLVERNAALSGGKRLMLMTVIFGSGLFCYAFERGNLVLTAAMLSAFFLFYYDSPDRTLRELALAALALAAGLKLSPAVFGLLLLYRRDFAGALRLLLYGLAAILLPFLTMPGTWDNLALLRLNMQENVTVYLYEPWRLGPTALLPVLTRILAHYGWAVPVEDLYRLVMAVFLPLSALLVLFAWRAPDRWRQVLMLSMLPFFVPGNSNWYNALYLLPALILFFNAPGCRRRDLLFPVVALILLSPLQLNGWTMAIRNLAVLLLFGEMLITGLLDFRRSCDPDL